MGKERIQSESFVLIDDFRSEEQMDTLVRTVHVFSIDIGMEFGMNKCGILTMKRRKVVRCEGIKLPNSEVMKEVKKEGCIYWS